MTNTVTPSTRTADAAAAETKGTPRPFDPKTIQKTDKSLSESPITLMRNLTSCFHQAKQGPVTLPNGVQIVHVPGMGANMDSFRVSFDNRSVTARPGLGLLLMANGAGPSSHYNQMTPAQQATAMGLLRSAVTGWQALGQ